MQHDSYAAAARFADRIELELRRLQLWQSEPLPPAAFESRAAFCADTMTFFQWLQFVLLDRVRSTIAQRGSFPSRSQVGVYAIRELDGYPEAGDLIGLLCDFDDFINRLTPSIEGAPDVARHYLDLERSRVRDAAGPDDPIQHAQYTTGAAVAADGGWDVPCHALLVYRNGDIVERHFALRLVANDGVLEVDPDASEGATRAYLSRLIIAANERGNEAGRLGDLDKVHAILAEVQDLCRQSDLDLRGLGLDLSTPPPSEVEADLPRPEPPPPAPGLAAPEPDAADPEVLHARAAAYWRARAAADPHAASFETRGSLAPGGFDVSRAETVWDGVTGFLETLGDPEETGGGFALRTMIDTPRGPLALLTVLRLDNYQWSVDRDLSLHATTRYWLNLHGDHHPFGAEESPRSVAMSFWHGLQMRWTPHLFDYVTPASRDRALPAIGSGQIDEFFFYLDDTVDEAAGKAWVRVLINTHDLVRIVHTPLFHREGQWLVDLVRTLRQLPEPA